MRHLSRVEPLDHEHGQRRTGSQLPGHAGDRPALAGGRHGGRRRSAGHRPPRAFGRAAGQRGELHNGISQQHRDHRGRYPRPDRRLPAAGRRAGGSAGLISTARPDVEAVSESGIELLEGMLAIPSPSTQERPLGQWLVARLRGMGFAARSDEAGNVVAYWGGGPREVMLLGHIDTVPGFIPVRRDKKRLFGRGAVDAKGPLAAAITAVARQSVGTGVRFTVIGAVEEEGSSRGARHLVSRRAPDQLVILEPSGWDAVTLGYKGSLRVRYRLAQPMGHGAGPNDSAGDKAIAFVRRLQDYARDLAPTLPSPKGG